MTHLTGAARVAASIGACAVVAFLALPAPAEVEAEPELLHLHTHIGGPIAGVAPSGEWIFVGEGVSVRWLEAGEPGFLRSRELKLLGPSALIADLAVRADRLFVGAADGVHRLRLDVAEDRLAPDGHLRTPGAVTGVAVFGDLLLVSDADYGLLVVDPDQLEVRAGLPLPGGLSGPVGVSGNLAVAPGDDAIVLALGAGTVHEVGRFVTSGVLRGVAYDGERAFVSDSTDGVLALDLSDPAQPTLIDAVPGLAAGPLVNTPGYLVLGGPGARVLGVSESGELHDIHGVPGPYTTIAGATDLAVADHRLIAALGSRMQVLDISDPELPTAAELHSSVWPVTDIEMQDNVALVAKGATGLDFVTVADFGPLEVAVSYAPPGGVFGAVVADDLGLLTTVRGVEALDVSNATEPILLGVVAPDWPATPWIDAAGGYLVSAGTEALYVGLIDGMTVEPVARLEYDLAPDWPASAMAGPVAIAGDRALMAAGPPGVVVFDLSDPQAPAYTGLVRLEGAARSVAATGDLAVVGLANGLASLDLSGLGVPVVVDLHKQGFAIEDLDLRGVAALAAAGTGGVLAFDAVRPISETLTTVYPPVAPIRHVAAMPDGALASGPGIYLLRNRPLVTPAPTAATPAASLTPPPTVATGLPPSPTHTLTVTATPSATPTHTVEPTSTREVTYRAFVPYASRP